MRTDSRYSLSRYLALLAPILVITLAISCNANTPNALDNTTDTPPVMQLASVEATSPSNVSDSASPTPETMLPSSPSIPNLPSVQRTIGIQAGHGNGDSGFSFCPIGEKIYSMYDVYDEASLNLKIAKAVVRALQRDGYNANLFIDDDPKIQGLRADAFVAIHASQGTPGTSGYKVARLGGKKGSGLNGSGDASDRLAEEISKVYEGVLFKDTVLDRFTEDLLNSRALEQIDPNTPGAVIEVGHLCDDLITLVSFADDIVAESIVNGIERFLLANSNVAGTGAGGRIAFISNVEKDIFVVNANGSGLTNLTKDRSVAAMDITWAPDGNKIAFTTRQPNNFLINVINPDGTGLTKLANGIYPAWSHDGTQIAFGCVFPGISGICSMNADGSKVARLTGGSALTWSPSWSPDGKYIAFLSAHGTGNDDGNNGYRLYRINTDGTGQLQLADTKIDPDEYASPVWSPDSKRIAFETGEKGFAVANADGSGSVEFRKYDHDPAWSPDGTRIAFARGDIYIMNADGISEPTNITKDFGGNSNPQWSPDGAKVAFRHVSYDPAAGESDIYVVNSDGSGLTRVTNNALDEFGVAWQPTTVDVTTAVPQSSPMPSISPVPTPVARQVLATNLVFLPLIAKSTMPVQTRAEPQFIGPEAVWMIPDAAWNQIRDCSSKVNCVASVMKSFAAAPQAIAFAKLLNGEAFMQLFRETGNVDLAGIVYPSRAE